MIKFDEIFGIIRSFYENIRPILNYDNLEITQKWKEYNDYEDLEIEMHILLNFENYKFSIFLLSVEDGLVESKGPKYQIISGDKSRGYRTHIYDLNKDAIEKICCENFLNSLSVISKDSPLFSILDIDRVRKTNE